MRLLLIIFLILGCTPKQSSQEALEYQSKLKKMDEELLILEQKIKLIQGDMGLKDQLSEEKELLNSRRKRLVEIMKAKKIPILEKNEK